MAYQHNLIDDIPVEDRIEDLEQLLKEDMVGDKDAEFAASLTSQFRKKKSLSDKQLYWVNVLIERAVGGEPEPAKVDIGNFGGMISLFQKAKEHLKFPKVRLQTADGEPVCLGVAGPNARKPGTINITDGEKYGQNQWFGRILTDGNWEQPKHVGPEFKAVERVLKKFAEDPAGVAAEYGKLTGNCCFCNKGLSDEKSTEVGYGPVCAKNFGLPWGKKS